MSEDGPVDVGLTELLNTDFTRESTVGPVEDILSRDTDLPVCDFTGEEEVEGRRGDDDLGGGVERGGVEVLDDGGSALSIAVPIIEIEKR